MSKPKANNQTPVSKRQRLFERLGLFRAEDFVTHLPLRYDDETRITPVSQLKNGDFVLLEGTILSSAIVQRGRRELRANLADATGCINLRWLHVYPGQLARMASGTRIRVKGQARVSAYGAEIIHPQISKPDTPLALGLTPVYPSTQGLSQPVLRSAIAQALDTTDLSETLPQQVLDDYQLASYEPSIRFLHNPSPGVSTEQLLKRAHPAWQRIKFDELLAQQLALAKARAHRLELQAPALVSDGLLLQNLRHNLGFTPTQAQDRASAEIIRDLQMTHPMHRLLQGDVGSGKTLVAAFAIAHASASGVQTAVMAPTEILAEQLYAKLSFWFQPLGIKPAWLSGSTAVAARRQALADIASGQAQVAVGTQALIQEKVQFNKLGLIINDEQHRFGVGQRLALSNKGCHNGLQPHQLSMSATPIPRTLAMAFFADMDVSVLNEMPPGRSPVQTKLINMRRREQIIKLLGQAITDGQQAYWVCPLVEESESLQLQTAVDTWELLKTQLPGLAIGLMHGRLGSVEKAQTMEDFRNAQLDILVSTTVIEVGVDVPNASIMIIEHAERFGLAQLHQLRGRVGRGANSSSCILMYQEPLSEVAQERLKAIHATHDGFEIAQRDLDLRGPGELLGWRQSGQQLLRFADLETDSAMLAKARKVAELMLDKYPEYVTAHLKRWAPAALHLLQS